MLLSIAVAASASKARADQNGIRTVLLPSPSSPLVTIRLVFQVGAADDELGKEGIAALTAASPLVLSTATSMSRARS